MGHVPRGPFWMPRHLRHLRDHEIVRLLRDGLLVYQDGFVYPRAAGGAAITATNVVANKSTTDLSSYTTATLTPANNKLYIASVVSKASAGTPNAPTASGGGGLTWVAVSTNTFATNQQRLATFRALKSSGLTSGTVTFDYAGQTQTSAIWSIEELDGTDLNGTDGSGAIVQSPTPSTGSGVSLATTLAAFRDPTNNVAFGAGGSDANCTFTPGGGFTELSDQTNASAGVNSMATEWFLGQKTSVAMTASGSAGWAMAGMEIAAPSFTPRARVVLQAVKRSVM